MIKCQTCQHSLDDHSVGQCRSFYPCDLDCDCQDFVLPEFPADAKLVRLIDASGLPTAIIIPEEDAVEYCKIYPGGSYKSV